MRRRGAIRRLRGALLAGLLLLPGCGATTLDMESNRSEHWNGGIDRLLVLLGREMGPGQDADAFGAALQRHLAGCGLVAEVLVPPPDADIALDGDPTERRSRERERALRPDALLAMRRASVASRSGSVAVTYDLLVLRVPDRKPVWRALATVRPSGDPGGSTPEFARLLVAHLARDGVLRPCPASSAH